MVYMLWKMLIVMYEPYLVTTAYMRYRGSIFVQLKIDDDIYRTTQVQCHVEQLMAVTCIQSLLPLNSHLLGMIGIVRLLPVVTYSGRTNSDNVKSSHKIIIIITVTLLNKSYAAAYNN